MATQQRWLLPLYKWSWVANVQYPWRTKLISPYISFQWYSHLSCKQLMSRKQNLSKNSNLEWLHTCEQKSVHQIASLGQHIKTYSNGLMLDGLDNIPPSFLKPLSPLILQELLSIFKSSFLLAHCTSIWRVAKIIPWLKAGKSPSEVATFRPISLTSCLVKLLERILANQLYYITKIVWFIHLSSIKFLTGYYLMAISYYNVICGYKYTEYNIKPRTQYNVMILTELQNSFFVTETVAKNL